MNHREDSHSSPTAKRRENLIYHVNIYANKFFPRFSVIHIHEEWVYFLPYDEVWVFPPGGAFHGFPAELIFCNILVNLFERLHKTKRELHRKVFKASQKLKGC